MSQAKHYKKKRVQRGKKIYLWDGPPPGYNAAYGQDFPSILPYLVKSKTPTASVIVCPGGGYEKLAEHEGIPVAEWLNSIGISAFVLNYRVAPYRYPHPYTDLRRAIAHLRFNAPRYHLDPSLIGVLGFSAGAHLCGLSGYLFDDGIADDCEPEERMSNRPDFMVLCYPVVSFVEAEHEGSVNHLLGENADYALREAVSVHKHVRKETPPAFIWHTVEDESVSSVHSLLLMQALIQQGIEIEAHFFSDRRQHGLGLAEKDKKVSTWTQLCAKWLDGVIAKQRPE